MYFDAPAEDSSAGGCHRSSPSAVSSFQLPPFDLPEVL